MALAVLNSCAPIGMTSTLVRTEVHIGPGLPSFLVVGQVSTGVKESRDRVRTAILSSGYEFPLGRITVNLSPADLPKDSGRFDLAIALGVLMATGQLHLSRELQRRLPHLYFVGELSLTGALTAIQSPLILALSIYKSDPEAVLIMPKSDAAMASLVEGLSVIGADSLGEVVGYLAGKRELTPYTADRLDAVTGVASDAAAMMLEPGLCLSDVRGQAQACYLLELAASGGHSLLFSGPSGVGKTMLAQRLPTILPDLTNLQRLERIAIQSVSANGIVDRGYRPSFRAPHHSISDPALLGGGVHAYPGELSLAHHGVLFLDELAEFKRSTLEALRVPLESGEISVARAHYQQRYPAKFQFVAATNPCACGYLDHPEIDCTCTHRAINQYQARVSGPLLERIDIHYKLPLLSGSYLEAEPAETSVLVRERVSLCRAHQLQRQGVLNVDLNTLQLTEFCRLRPKDQSYLEITAQQKAWSARIVQSVLKLARSAADMRGAELIEREDVALAIACRQPFSKKEEARLYWYEARKGTAIHH